MASSRPRRWTSQSTNQRRLRRSKFPTSVRARHSMRKRPARRHASNEAPSGETGRNRRQGMRRTIVWQTDPTTTRPRPGEHARHRNASLMLTSAPERARPPPMATRRKREAGVAVAPPPTRDQGRSRAAALPATAGLAIAGNDDVESPSAAGQVRLRSGVGHSHRTDRRGRNRPRTRRAVNSARGRRRGSPRSADEVPMGTAASPCESACSRSADRSTASAG